MMLLFLSGYLALTCLLTKLNNMNENINLSEILKGHEGETFYSPAYGELKLRCIDSHFIKLSFNCSDGYGGNVSKEEWMDNKLKFVIVIDPDTNDFI